MSARVPCIRAFANQGLFCCVKYIGKMSKMVK